MLGVTSHFCRSSRYQVSWHGHIRIRWDTVNFCCCTCLIDHGSFCHPRHSRHFGAHAQFKAASFDLDAPPKGCVITTNVRYSPNVLSNFFQTRACSLKVSGTGPAVVGFPWGHRGGEGEDHQLVRICLKKQRKGKKEGNETVVRGRFLRLSKEISGDKTECVTVSRAQERDKTVS